MAHFAKIPGLLQDLLQSREASTDMLRSSWLVSTNKKHEAHDVDVLSIKRIDYQLANINDNYVFLMGDNGDQRGPEAKFEAGHGSIVTVIVDSIPCEMTSYLTRPGWHLLEHNLK